MEDTTTPDEQAMLMATCLLDGEGEQWQRMASVLLNAIRDLTRVSGGKVEDEAYKSARELEYFRDWNPTDEREGEQVDWAATEAMLKGMAGL